MKKYKIYFNLDEKVTALVLVFWLVFSQADVSAQTLPDLPDSARVRIYPRYDSVSVLHRFFFGENYRREYAMATNVPVIRLSTFNGGLKIVRKGGGNQSHSLRLIDKTGKEWVLRSVEKFPDPLLPEMLRTTVAATLLKDNMSAQHPFSALVVPELARAAGIPASQPVIGLIAQDENLGEYSHTFAGTICLLEEREPMGNSDNSSKMLRNLTSNNTYTVDSRAWLRARAFDVLLGDWDRHEDQWRWKLKDSLEIKVYLPVPRDRDQVFFSSDGLMQRLSQSSWFLPMMQGYEKDIRNINWFLWEGRELNGRITASMNRAEWNREVSRFCSTLSIAAFTKSLEKLPSSVTVDAKRKLTEQFSRRLQQLPSLMDDYYLFCSRTVDIELSNSSEDIEVFDLQKGKLLVRVYRKQANLKNRPVIFERLFQPDETREIRIYLHAGDDSLRITNHRSPIRIRTVGGAGKKYIQLSESKNKITYYGDLSPLSIDGAHAARLRAKLSADTSNISFVPKDPYIRRYTFLTGGYNIDDGLLLGLNHKISIPGFRKAPFGSLHDISALYSFASSAFRLYYRGEWTKAIGAADLIVLACATAPGGQNFFGSGNGSLVRTDVSRDYYRTRYSLFQFDPQLHWKHGQSSIAVGPSFHYYSYRPQDNIGRFTQAELSKQQLDDLLVPGQRFFAGINAEFKLDTRNPGILTTKGSLLNVSAKGYADLQTGHQSFVQLTGSFALYRKLQKEGRFVISERMGGTISLGQPAYYQMAFLGGQNNLLGFRQYRFTGRQMLYNNLEVRARLGDFVSYILPGEFGLLGLYDVGKVWTGREDAQGWHHGSGAGAYFAPATMTVVRMVAAHSAEGWYPYLALAMRF